MKESCAIVTGASRGIGRAVAITLAKKGYNIVVHYNSSKKLAEELAEEIKKQYKVDAIAVKADMSCYDEIDSLVSLTLKQFKKIDVLVNNAGVCFDEEFCNRTVQHFERTFKINTFGVFHISKLVGEHMMQNKFGKIINISSNNSINGFYPTTIDYDASKSALNSMTRNMAIQFSPYVNVNAIAPGWIDTDMNKDVLTPDIAELESQRILKRRIGKSQDVANLVSFLVSPESEYINGEIVVIDGGMF